MKTIGAVAIVVAITVRVLTPPAWASGYFAPSASFLADYQPDPPLDQYAGGRLGIIKPTWDHSYLYVAYRYLAGPGFHASEQKTVLSLWADRLAPHLDWLGQVRLPAPPAKWLATRNKVPGVSALDHIDVYRQAPAENWVFDFVNCNDSAFNTAATTLETMIGKFGLSSAQVKRWVDAQDQVFQNCSPASSPNAWQQAPHSTVQATSPQIPEPLNDGTPFERAQRTYQIACAYFYSGNFDTAAKMFDAIAADPSSPWRQLAPYLVARAMIRKATLSAEKDDHALLAQAEAQLNKIIAAPADDGVRHSAQQLLGFVQAQLHPEQREEELAHAVMVTTSGDVLKQDLSDYIWMLDHGRTNDNSYRDDLTDWISTLSAFGENRAGTDSPARAREKWKSTSSLPWLVAAISLVPGSDPDAPALIKAAERVKRSSPAYVTVAFHVDRILIEQGKSDAARARLDAILAKPDALPRSAYNQFSWLRLKLARNLDEYLRYALRYPVAIEVGGYDYLTYAQGHPVAVDAKVFGDQLNDPSMLQLAAGPLFDKDSAEVMDRWLPLSVLKEIARSPILPPPLRARVALSVWVRGILAGDGQTARELTAIVSNLVPALKPSLDAWLAAKSGDERRFEIALTMLRNPGMRPYVDPGIGRLSPLGKLDSFRDNWWPAMIDSAALPVRPPPPGSAVAQAPVYKYPSFLSAAERESADREWAKMSPIDGPNFLCSEVIQQAGISPKDKRVPESLFRCIYAVHLGPARNYVLGEAAFHLLHRRYPNSMWAQENRFWYRAEGKPLSVTARIGGY